MPTIINNQTVEQRYVIFREFLAAMRAQRIRELADDSHNFVTIANQIDAVGTIFSGDNIRKAVNALGWQAFHWLPDPAEVVRQQAQQRAAHETQQKNQAELRRILEGFASENDEVIWDQHNLDKLWAFIKAERGNVLDEEGVRQFWYVMPDLHRKALPLPEPVRRKSDRELSAQYEQERREARERQLEKQAKSPEALLQECYRINRIREMSYHGPDWAATWHKQRQEYEGLKTRFPDFTDKIDALIAKVGS